MKRSLPFIVVVVLSACSPSPKGKAICNCVLDKSTVAIYTLSKESIAQADTQCLKIESQLPKGDSCWAFIDN
jgi:hypothetical protein